MALFKILKGQQARLPNTSKQGYAYYTTDKGKFYIFNSETQRRTLNPDIKITIGNQTKTSTTLSPEVAFDLASIGAAAAGHNHDGRYAWQCETLSQSGRVGYSGFYQVLSDNNPVKNRPVKGWMHLINAQHSNTANNFALQIAGGFQDNKDFYIRQTNNSDATIWNRILTNNNYTSYVTTLRDRTNGTATYSNYGASNLAGSAISCMTCWNGYELRAISKAEVYNLVRDNGGNNQWVKKAGDTMTGTITLLGNQYADNYSGALNANNSNIYGVNSIYTADLADTSAEGIHFYRTSTTVDSLWIKNGVIYFTPNRTLGKTGIDYTIIHSGNYTDYTVKKDGTGATGNWNININKNAATATKLQTPRSLWGNSFDGSSDIFGNITLNGTAVIAWPDSGNWRNSNKNVTFPVVRGGLSWSGQSDYIKLNAVETGNNNLQLYLQFGDDNSNGLSIRNAANQQTARISASGIFTGNGSGLTNLPAGNLTGTISMDRIADRSIGNGKLTNSKITIAGKDVSLGGSLTLADIGAAAAGHNHDDKYLKLSGGTMTGDIIFTNKDANRLIWTDKNKKVSTTGHYATSDRVAINSASYPGYNLLVNGTTHLQGQAATRTVRPDENKQYSLGTNDYKWSALYVSGNAQIDGSIKNLAVNGGIYWNPHVESTGDASDAASIEVIKAGASGGTQLRIQQQNDANDVVNIVTQATTGFKHNGHTVWDDTNDGPGSGADADLLDGCHGSYQPSPNTYVRREDNGYTKQNYILYTPNKGQNPSIGSFVVTNTGDNYLRFATKTNVVNQLAESPGTLINNNGHTYSITVTGNANTYYPVVIDTPLEKEAINYVSIWKNLGSQTATYTGNHDSGTSSMWLIYEVRKWLQDGNGGYLKCWYYSMPYANLCATTSAAGSGSGKLVVYLRGGTTSYNISTTYKSGVSVYYQETNLGNNSYPVRVSPTTNIGNRGKCSTTFLGYGDVAGNADTSTIPLGFASRSTNATWGNQTGTTITCWDQLSGGSVDFRRNNPSNGKLSIKVNGRFYGNEGSYPAMLIRWRNNYWGLGNPDGDDSDWIRTTVNGLIPFQSGGQGNGHSALGTSSWYFKEAFIDTVNGTNLYLHGQTANRLVWLNSSKMLDTTGHYASGSKIAVNSISDPGYNFYVNGTSYFVNNVGIAGYDANYKLYTNGKSLFNGDIYLTNKGALIIYGDTVGSDANTLISKTVGVLSYGDTGPKIDFGTSATGNQRGAIIFTDHDAAGAGVSWHFVSNQNDWNVNSKRFVAKTSITIGQNLPNTKYNLYVNGSTYLNGTLWNQHLYPEATKTYDLGSTSYIWNNIYGNQLWLYNLQEGNSDITDNTEILTSYASNDGFADSNAVGKVYKRDAIHLYNYIISKTDNFYVKKAGDTMTGSLSFSGIGDVATSAKISWSGSTDGADIYYQTTAADQGNLVLNTRDDANCYIRFAYNGAFKSYIRTSDGTYIGKLLGISDGTSWINGQRYEKGGFNLSDATNTTDYWPWLRQTNTSSARWFSFGTLGNCFYMIGSSTGRTDNGYDHGLCYDISNGNLSGINDIYTSSIYTSNWFRSQGNSGWYSQNYGGGWYMTDSTWIRSFNDKSLYTGTGTIRSEREIQSTSIEGVCQFRAIGGAYGAMLRNDGADTYILLTNAGDQYGSWNGLRPFRINNGSGIVYIQTSLIYQHFTSVGNLYVGWNEGSSPALTASYGGTIVSGSGNVITDARMKAVIANKHGSDRRVKQNIRDLSIQTIKKIYMNFKPVRYEFKQGALADKYAPGERFGYIAQDMESSFLKYGVNPGQLVYHQHNIDKTSKLYSYLGECNLYTIDYENLHALHTLMIQQHDSQIEQLKKQNKKLQQQIQLLNAKLDTLVVSHL